MTFSIINLANAIEFGSKTQRFFYQLDWYGRGCTVDDNLAFSCDVLYLNVGTLKKFSWLIDKLDWLVTEDTVMHRRYALNERQV